jgi:secreted PhoX family phosphatase
MPRLIPEPEVRHRRSSETFARVFRRRVRQSGAPWGTLARALRLVPGHSMGMQGVPAEDQQELTLTFTPLKGGDENGVVVPFGYTANTLIRWGEALHLGVAAFDVRRQRAAQQARQFGYHCDFVAYFPQPDYRSRHTTRGILAVNHGYTAPELMFPTYVPGSPVREQVDVELAAHGVTLVEVVRLPLGEWRYRIAADFNRRLTGESEIAIAGPAAGHDWLKVSYDPSGTRGRGTLSNRTGGVTPWGTYLTCEDNFEEYFANRDGLPDGDPRKAVHARYDLPTGSSRRRWELHHARFDLRQEPNEAFRFGWVVEIDPYDPQSVPRKRTSLGRLRHKGGSCLLAPDGRTVVYLGDGGRSGCVYKFVTVGQFSIRRREPNFDLLDSGRLSVARFHDDGTGKWLPLVCGEGPLTTAHGIASQADVLINPRRAADLLGATTMDSLENVEPNPVNGKIYCAIADHIHCPRESIDGVTPRAANRHTHIIELTEDSNNPIAETFTWETCLPCADMNYAEHDTHTAGFEPSRIGPNFSPGLIKFDPEGNLWTTASPHPPSLKQSDGLYAIPLRGRAPGHLRKFLGGVQGGELAGLGFSPNGQALFCSIRSADEGTSLGCASSTRIDGALPPRPGVIVVGKTADGSRLIGS